MKRASLLLVAAVVGWALAPPARPALAEELEVGTTGPAETTPVTILKSDEPAGSLSAAAGSAYYFQMYVAPGTQDLSVATSGGSGDCDLYLANGYLPEPDHFDYVSNKSGTNEKIALRLPRSGDWYLLVYGQSDFSDVSLAGSWEARRLQQVYETHYASYPPETIVSLDWYRPDRVRVIRRICLVRRPRIAAHAWWRWRGGFGVSLSFGTSLGHHHRSTYWHPPIVRRDAVISPHRVIRRPVIVRRPRAVSTLPRVIVPRHRSTGTHGRHETTHRRPSITPHRSMGTHGRHETTHRRPIAAPPRAGAWRSSGVVPRPAPGMTLPNPMGRHGSAVTRPPTIAPPRFTLPRPADAVRGARPTFTPSRPTFTPSRPADVSRRAAFAPSRPGSTFTSRPSTTTGGRSTTGRSGRSSSRSRSSQAHGRRSRR